MAGAYKREGVKRYRIWWIDENGKRAFGTGTTDKRQSEELANRKEHEARLVRDGLVDPGEHKRKQANRVPLAQHIADYRAGLLAKGDKPRHAQHMAMAVTKLLAASEVHSIADIQPDRIQAALRTMLASRSRRTCMHALGAVKAFAKWLTEANRIQEVPRGLRSIALKDESAKPKRQRRAATPDEVKRLLAAADAGEPVVVLYGKTKSKHHGTAMTGPERAALYRLAMGTGFRANELRSLTPESFAIDGPSPTVTVEAAYAKNGRKAVQPITREMAEAFRPFLVGKEAGKPVLPVPEKTAKLLRRDLAAAGIPYQDDRQRFLDFHALRASYITHLINSGANIKVVQALARHSTITLTMDVYAKTEDTDLRSALEGGAERLRERTETEQDGE